jgi:hypothetical protein
VKPYIVALEAESDLRQIWRDLLGEAGLAVADKIRANSSTHSRAWPKLLAKVTGVPI